MNAIDTNVWIYSHDDRDSAKQEKAQQLIASTGLLALPWQVGCEFVAAARKLEVFGFDQQRAWIALEDIRDMADVILFPTAEVWDRARVLQPLHQLQFWDALIIAACLCGGVWKLFSEDLPSLPDIGDLAIVNPFV